MRIWIETSQHWHDMGEFKSDLSLAKIKRIIQKKLIEEINTSRTQQMQNNLDDFENNLENFVRGD